MNFLCDSVLPESLILFTRDQKCFHLWVSFKSNGKRSLWLSFTAWSTKPTITFIFIWQIQNSQAYIVLNRFLLGICYLLSRVREPTWFRRYTLKSIWTQAIPLACVSTIPETWTPSRQVLGSCRLWVAWFPGLCPSPPNTMHTLGKTHFSSVQFSRLVVSNSFRPHESQHARPPCPSPSPGVHSDSCPSSPWCHPAISSLVVPVSSCPQSLPASVFSNESTLHMRWPKYWSFSFSISPCDLVVKKWKVLK